MGGLLATAGAVVICGGGTGVMAAATAGARAENDLVIGIRPHDTAEDTCPDLSAVIVTNLGEARNAVIVWSADAPRCRTRLPPPPLHSTQPPSPSPPRAADH